MKFINFTEKDFDQNKVGIIEISRPEALNALNREVLSELEEQIDKIAESRKFRAVIIKGAGEKAFVAGADIKEMMNLSQKEGREFAQSGQRVFLKIECLSTPTIAQVQGFALGGGMELALSCDFIVAGHKAKFGLPEVGLGLIPGFGGTQRLTRRIGIQKAKEMIFTGAVYTAEEVLRMGLISQTVDPGELEKVVMAKAEMIASKGPLALQKAKEALHLGYDMTLTEGLQNEAQLFSELFESNDTKEGLKAFVEKRKPNFQNK
jgi:enoyl-CoA hydratase